jgi:heterodisulfide reductase subunit A
MVENPVIIVGGGTAGLAVAKILIDSGQMCMIVERDSSLGGHVRNWACMATEQCQRCFCCLIGDLVRDVSTSEMAKMLTSWELTSMLPSEGDSRQVLLRDIGTGKEIRAAAPALVFATGFEPYNPVEKILWGHGRLKGVYTLAEVDALLRQDMLSTFADGDRELRVAFFQCVGSRDKSTGANYCSQYCCKAALRMALKLVHECPKIAATIFYIDLQVAGKYAGELLRKAKEHNVRLCQGVPGEIAEGVDESLEIILEQQGKNVKECFDRVILSIGQRPPGQILSVAEQLGLSVNEFGFMQPRGTLDSSRMALPGVYVAGTCVGPKDIEQTLEHAGQTAQAILADLRKRRVR